MVGTPGHLSLETPLTNTVNQAGVLVVALFTHHLKVDLGIQWRAGTKIW